MAQTEPEFVNVNRGPRIVIINLYKEPWARVCKRFRSPGIGSKESIPPAYVAWRAGKTNRVTVPARQAGGIDSLESIPALLKRLQTRAQGSSV
jgi:hypothetical protein